MRSLSHYELVEVLGSGGMGHVYRGVHRPSGRVVAVKMLHPEAAEDARRRRLFLDEATAAARIDDPRIVRLLDLGRSDAGQPFLVMDLAEGVGLDALLEAWPGWPIVSRALKGILAGLASAHAAGVVHRDLKPANVMVDPTSGAVRILDFGVAALVDPLRRELRDDVVGTPEYMPPEQLLGTGPYGPWTDLYAFGVLLARAVRGESPFASFDNVMQLLVAKAHYAPRVRAPLRPGLEAPDELSILIERLLTPQPRERPRFAVEVARALDALDGRITDRVVPAPARLEAEESTQRTIIDGPATAPVSGLDLLPLPTRLPAPADLTVGAALSRLREVPLVGRAAERRELAALVERVVEDRAPRLLVLVGETGIGKSRLARWGLAHVEREGRMEGAGGGYDLSGADVAGGLRHALGFLVGLPPTGWDESWAYFEGDPDLDVDALRSFLSASSETTWTADMVATLAHATLRKLGRARPIYLWLDDLGWARDGALELVERMLEACDAPVLVVATMRSGTTEHTAVQQRLDRLLEHERTTVRTLGPLEPAAAVELLNERAPLVPGVAEALASRIEGSPLLLGQLIDDWLAQGLLVASGPVVRTRDGAPVDALLAARPLATLLDERVDGLLAAFEARAGEALDILGRAAFLGQRFEAEALRAACAADAILARSLDAILDRALLLGAIHSERDGLYAFDSALLRDGLIERAELAPGRNAALIGAANGLQSRYGKERPDIAALVADLLHRAGDEERAWARQLHAITRSAWAGDDPLAQRYLAVALAWAADQPLREAQAERTAARVHYFALRYEQALAHLERARDLAEALGETVLALSCDAHEADTLFYLDRFAESERLARRCFEGEGVEREGADQSVEELDTRAQAAHRLADLATLRGDYEEALEWRMHVIELTDASGQPWRLRVARLNEAELFAALGRHEEARRLTVRILEEAVADRDEHGADAARDNLLRIAALEGGVDPAAVSALEARIEAVRAGSDAWRLTGLLVPRALFAAREDDASAERWTRALVAAFTAVPHDEAFSIEGLRALVLAHRERGRDGLANDVEALREARAARYRAGFEG